MLDLYYPENFRDFKEKDREEYCKAQEEAIFLRVINSEKGWIFEEVLLFISATAVNPSLDWNKKYGKADDASSK